MTNNIFRTHIARTRRLVVVTVSVIALGGFGAVAAHAGSPAGATTEPACAAIASTPTATTVAPDVPEAPHTCATPTASPA